MNVAASMAAAPGPMAERFWPQWRGPYANGVSKYADPPLEWSETKNVRWKVEIPGRGSASPIVWGDRVFVLSAVPAGLGGGGAPPPPGGGQPPGGPPVLRLPVRSAPRQGECGTNPREIAPPP